MGGLERQTRIYADGIGGKRPPVPSDATKLEARARRKMSRRAFAYVAAGAGTEATVRENREAFERWRIVPHMLRDVSTRDTHVELFGRRLPGPFLIAPIGVLELAHRDADLAVARAARSTGVPMVLSSQASRRRGRSKPSDRPRPRLSNGVGSTSTGVRAGDRPFSPDAGRSDDGRSVQRDDRGGDAAND
jgi:isopentenyl diphosphate isomerase/L-lactate dehydrogenase-like FMN-dependent dehydrogenase